MAEDNVIQFIPAGKVRCYITGKLRPDRPEENVRQRWARSLVEEYRYDRSDMAIEFTIQMGVQKKRADIVVFKPGSAHKQDNVFLIIEAKLKDVLPKAKDNGIEQLKSYMAASSSCRYGLWIGSERQGFERLADGQIEEGLADIPSRGDLEPVTPTYANLSPAVDLTATFRRCHNYIYANQGLQKAEAFHEMLKLIFCKVYDETENSSDLKFFIRTEERRSEAGQHRLMDERVAPLFEAVKSRYPYIFKQGEEVGLSRRVLAYIVSEMQRLSLLRTQTDVKGHAYEEMVGENLRGDRGEYFTPRNVCDMAVQMILATYAPSKLSDLKVIDICCGTGGFLVAYVNYMRRFLTAQEAKRAGTTEEEARYRVSTRIKDLCSRNVFGLDINPFLVRTCQMNLVMHGDGSANIFQADSIVSPGEWDNKETAGKVKHGRFDLVVTNPPFGGKANIDDPHILGGYELSKYDSKNPRSFLPAEQLFVEAAMKFLKPGGHLAIVLPDSILNNPGLLFIRSWLLRRAKIVASVDLPKETFATSGGVPNPSVLIVQKLTTAEIVVAEAKAMDYEVFMAIPKTAGINKRGAEVPLRTPEGDEIRDEHGELVLDDEIGLVADSFASWVKRLGYVS